MRVGEREVAAAQCNNLYMFPGVGLGALVSQASKVTDRMFICASKTLAAMVRDDELERGLLLPSMEVIRDVAFTVAKAVAIEARDAGLGLLRSDAELGELIARAQWMPHFYSYRPGVPR